MTTRHPPRPCPACGARDPELLRAHRFAMIDSVSVLDGYDIVACARCGMTYADRIPSQAMLDHYYADASKYAYPQREGLESPADAARLRITADTIAAHVRDRDARILDVGCASGRLLSELRDRGFRSLRGIDPSPACVAAARHHYGITADVSTIGQLARRGDRFDLIVLVGVLEHLNDLAGALDTLRTLLAPRGVVYVEVPDVTRFVDYPNAPYQEFSVEHVNYFSPGSLQCAFAARGFACSWIEGNTRATAPGTVVSNVSAIARPGFDSAARPTVRDGESRPAVERYLRQSATDDEALRRRLSSLLSGGDPVILWGAGTLTLRLVAEGAFDGTNVVALTDSSMRYHGARAGKWPIVAPSALPRHGVRIIIMSRAFGPEIAQQAGKLVESAAMVSELYQDR